jgi:hypothetical protein
LEASSLSPVQNIAAMELPQRSIMLFGRERGKDYFSESDM